MTLIDMLNNSANTYPDKTAIIFENSFISYRELIDNIFRVTNMFLDLGVKKGDRVVLYLGNSPEFIYSHIGVINAGGITVPLNILYRHNEISYMIQDCGAKIVITDEERYQILSDALTSCPHVKNVLIVSEKEEPSGTLKFHSLMKKYPASPSGLKFDDDDVAVICYTSGTTGRAKGAMLTHRNFISNIEALVSTWHWTNQDRLIMALPIFHVHGLGVVTHGVIYTGGSMVLMRRFNAEEVLKSITRYRCNVFMGVPTMYARLLEIENPSQYDLSHMKLFVSGSAPLPAENFIKFKEIYGYEPLERYGMSETIMNTSNPYDKARKPGSVGMPLPGVEIRIVDEQDNDIPVNEVGEIILRGSNLMKGYWNMPEETHQAMKNGWFYTGDLGKKDADGYIYIVGRKKEMIIVGGFKVYPRELEELLSIHPKIKESCVIGIKDEIKGEKVKAYVVLRENEQMGREDVIEYCRCNIASFKVPRVVEFIDVLPRTATGKIQKNLLS